MRKKFVLLVTTHRFLGVFLQGITVNISDFTEVITNVTNIENT